MKDVFKSSCFLLLLILLSSFLGISTTSSSQQCGESNDVNKDSVDKNIQIDEINSYDLYFNSNVPQDRENPHESGINSLKMRSNSNSRVGTISQRDAFPMRDPLLKDYIEARVELSVMTSQGSFYHDMMLQLDASRETADHKYVEIDKKSDERFDELESKFQRDLEQLEHEIKELSDLKAFLKIFASIVGVIGISTLPQLFRLVQAFYAFIVSTSMKNEVPMTLGDLLD